MKRQCVRIVLKRKLESYTETNNKKIHLEYDYDVIDTYNMKYHVYLFF